MATKTISIDLEAYARLRAARKRPDESFSRVILRARWPEETITAGDFLVFCREHGPHFTLAELDRVEKLKSKDEPPEDKWKRA